ncbi:MAG: phosphopantetheine-binding protein [Anaerolineales bacterium]|nr:MAG: phosphopantetheine-binding protein [Anaerolineales bacterium]
MKKTSKDFIILLLGELFPQITRDKDMVTNQRLREDLNLDSLDMINLQLAIEDRLHYKFDPLENNLAEVFESVESVASFLDYIGFPNNS